MTRVLAALIDRKWRHDANRSVDSTDTRGMKRELLIGVGLWMSVGTIILALNA